MDKRRNRNRRSPGFNVGSASIIMVFSVLCLTLFAVMSLVTSNSDLKLTRRAAQSLQDYYAAEYSAESRVLEIRQALLDGGTKTELQRDFSEYGLSFEDDIIRFTEPVDERRDLSVALAVGNSGKFSILEWRLLANDDWNSDSGAPVWRGTE